MHRLGFQPKDFIAAHHRLTQNEFIKKPIVMASHFACADDLTNPFTNQQMKNLEDECGETLPKGSGANAKEKAKALAERLGADSLNRFCKLHFKTAYEALGKTPPAKKAWNPNWGRGKKS
jgi:alanine racemase